jgi:hypothetical protein
MGLLLPVEQAAGRFFFLWPAPPSAWEGLPGPILAVRGPWTCLSIAGRDGRGELRMSRDRYDKLTLIVFMALLVAVVLAGHRKGRHPRYTSESPVRPRCRCL